MYNIYKYTASGSWDVILALILEVVYSGLSSRAAACLHVWEYTQNHLESVGHVLYCSSEVTLGNSCPAPKCPVMICWVKAKAETWKHKKKPQR